MSFLEVTPNRLVLTAHSLDHVTCLHIAAREAGILDILTGHIAASNKILIRKKEGWLLGGQLAVSATWSFDFFWDRHKIQTFFPLLIANFFSPEHSKHYESVAPDTACHCNFKGLLFEPDLSSMLPLSHCFVWVFVLFCFSIVLYYPQGSCNFLGRHWRPFIMKYPSVFATLSSTTSTQTICFCKLSLPFFWNELWPFPIKKPYFIHVLFQTNNNNSSNNT